MSHETERKSLWEEFKVQGGEAFFALFEGEAFRVALELETFHWKETQRKTKTKRKTFRRDFFLPFSRKLSRVSLIDGRGKVKNENEKWSRGRSKSLPVRLSERIRDVMIRP